MVLAEKQNLPANRRHRMAIERMMNNRILISPPSRLHSRPSLRPESQILRSMDLFGLERDNPDVTSHPSIFQSLFQTVLDTISPRSNMSHSLHDPPSYSQHDAPIDISMDTPVSMSQSRRDRYVKSEPDVHVIPITFIEQEHTRPGKQHKAHPNSIVISDIDNGKNFIDAKVNESIDGISTAKVVDSSITSIVEIHDEDCDTCPIEVINCDAETSRVTDKNCNINVTKKHSTALADKVFEDNNSTFPSSSLVRESLPQLSVTQRSKDSFSEKVITIDKLDVERDHKNQSVKTVRSNKDTLIGGANKVLESDNVDIPSGATYLTGNMSTSSFDMHSHSDEEKPVNEVPDYPIYSFLKKKLMKECRQVDYIKGDGNCFFRALSKQLYGSERYHIVLRNLIVDIIATNKNSFAQFVDGGDVQDHVERMSQEQSWATTCEIYAAATLLQRDIFMLTPDHLNQTYSWLLFKPVFKQDTQHSNIESHPCYITLCNTNGNHYDRIAGEHGGCNCFLPHPELEGVSYNVDLTC